MTTQPSRLEFTLPGWIAGYAGGDTLITGLARRMDFVIEAARLNVEHASGGPFAAAVFERDSGRLVSLGVNLVTTLGVSALHAEIVAITLAQRQAGTWDLGAAGLPRHELVASAEPCAMCIGALCWSGVVRVVTGATEADARAIGFDEGPRPADWCGALEDRGMEVVTGVNRDGAAAVLAEYARRGGIIYNSRGS